MFPENNVFPRITVGGNYFFFRTKRGRLFVETRLFHILLTGSRALNILITPLNKKIITPNELTIFWWLDQIPLQHDRQGIEEREDGERGGGGGAINRGTEEIRSPSFLFVTAKRLSPFVFLWFEKILIAGNAIGGSPPANPWGVRGMETYDISD